jgi:polyisoprenoid-binding protein YceI
MKNIFFSVLAIIAITLMSFKVANENPYKIDVAGSQLKWTGYHLAKSYEHTGYVKIKSGQFSTDGEKITSGNIVIDMTTLTNIDLTKEKDNAKLVKHLKSDDFFGVDKNPEAKIVIKNSEKISEHVYKTTADVTIKGITKEIQFETNIKSASDTELVASATLKIQRTDFEVMYGWNAENAMLDGEFQMEVKIIAKK